jgi:hypothetical protein
MVEKRLLVTCMCATTGLYTVHVYTCRLLLYSVHHHTVSVMPKRGPRVSIGMACRACSIVDASSGLRTRSETFHVPWWRLLDAPKLLPCGAKKKTADGGGGGAISRWALLRHTPGQRLVCGQGPEFRQRVEEVSLIVRVNNRESCDGIC